MHYTLSIKHLSAMKRSQFKTLTWMVFITSFVMLSLIFPGQTAADPASDKHFFQLYYEKVGDRFYGAREIPGNNRLAVANYKKALKFSDDKADLQWKITRCYWFLADEAVERPKRKGYFQSGVQYGKLAIKSDPGNSNAHLWYGLIVGSEAIDQGVVNSLYKRDGIRKELEKALSLNPENTNAYVGLASWYFHVPAVLGGSREKAMQLINRAIAIEPNYTTARMLKSEFLIEENRTVEARKELRLILKIKEPAIRGDGVNNRAKAESMLKDLKKVSRSNP